MDDIARIALQLREAINIAISVLSLTLLSLFVPYIVGQWRDLGYRGFGWPEKLCIGLIFLFAGECLRSSTVWTIIHFEAPGTYLTDIAPLIASLLLIVIGALCVIRVMSPHRCGHKLWGGALFVVVALVATNYLLG